MRSFLRLIALTIIGAAPLFAQAEPFDGDCKEDEKSFRAFLSKFTDDKAFQLKRIVFPLVARFGNPQVTTPTIELWGHGAIGDFKNPLILSRSERQRRGIEQRVTVATEAYSETYHFRPEADSYQILYLFRKYDGCWYLEGMHDTSL